MSTKQPRNIKTQPTTHKQSGVSVAAHWQGPLPPPSVLREFDNALPGTAERIVRMAESEVAHRQAHENQVLSNIASDTKRGHYIGFAITTMCVAAAVYCVWLRLDWEFAAVFIGLPLVVIVQSFLGAKKR